MAMQISGDADDVVSEINVTPLVDVMLVLLVVFIITAPMMTMAVKVALPQTAVTAPTEPKKSTYISVDKAGKIYVDKQEFALANLEIELKRRRQDQPDILINLNADEGVNYGLVAKVMSSVDRAGITKLSVLTEQE
ncbi:MAG: biopolymer transporter ExbD [Deltaproteobacteria bacterium]|nr:biopolymer transporter ExbD [Deltaproteobacteria bacterium]